MVFKIWEYLQKTKTQTLISLKVNILKIKLLFSCSVCFCLSSSWSNGCFPPPAHLFQIIFIPVLKDYYSNHSANKSPRSSHCAKCNFLNISWFCSVVVLPHFSVYVRSFLVLPFIRGLSQWVWVLLSFWNKLFPLIFSFPLASTFCSTCFMLIYCTSVIICTSLFVWDILTNLNWKWFASHYIVFWIG